MKPWLTILTAIIAVYGAVLSTVNSISHWRTKRRHVRVEVKRGYLVSTAPRHVRGANMIFVQARNTGYRSVVLSAPGFRLPNKREAVIPLPIGSVSLPHELKDGNNCTVWADPKELIKAMKGEKLSGKVKLRGFFVDALDCRHLSRSFIFDMTLEEQAESEEGEGNERNL